ncbi:T6SS effector amidase Tae4 family protein [Pseudoduganella lutea]|nr:T6SS effector amidase Tae4 family protein [Pseudoduganella lutea]
MKKHYPDSSIPTPLLYDSKICGKFVKLYEHPAYLNTCAVRMSFALNRSGLKLGKSPSAGGSVQGGDGFLYWIRVTDLKVELANRFKGADEELNLPQIPASMLDDNAAMSKLFKERVAIAKEFIKNKLARRSGIIVFDVSGWGDASGHFTLWDGVSEKLAYATDHDDSTANSYYFWLTMMTDGGKVIQTTKVRFWELK